jgi:hypothetical protein
VHVAGSYLRTAAGPACSPEAADTVPNQPPVLQAKASREQPNAGRWEGKAAAWLFSSLSCARCEPRLFTQAVYGWPPEWGAHNQCLVMAFC